MTCIKLRPNECMRLTVAGIEIEVTVLNVFRNAVKLGIRATQEDLRLVAADDQDGGRLSNCSGR